MEEKANGELLTRVIPTIAKLFDITPEETIGGEIIHGDKDGGLEMTLFKRTPSTVSTAATPSESSSSRLPSLT